MSWWRHNNHAKIGRSLIKEADEIERRGVYKLNASSITFTHGEKDILKVDLETMPDGTIKETWQKVADEEEISEWFDVACDYIRKVIYSF